MEADLSQPMWGLRAVTNIRELFISSSMRLVFAEMPERQFLTKDWEASPRRRMEWSTLWAMRGLKTFSQKWPLRPPTVTAVWLPITWAQTIVMASHWVGFTLPGMMLDPGSFSGRFNSPRPLRGPLPRKRMSLAILKRLTATVLREPWKSTRASLVARDSNLFGAVTK